jgi:nicotinamide-nucleotide amidase
VGTVWIAVALKDRVYSKKYVFGENRDRNIEQSSMMAMSLLRKMILGII